MRRQAGQALLEALALSMALAIALLLPISSGQPMAAVLLQAIVDLLRAQSYVLSIV